MRLGSVPSRVALGRISESLPGPLFDRDLLLSTRRRSGGVQWFQPCLFSPWTLARS